MPDQYLLEDDGENRYPLPNEIIDELAAKTVRQDAK
ncbi:MAG: hypothetical protein ACJAT7_000601 [Psychromonas sp.]|jgi:hypothetical protein